ncbi:hypothetical protein AB0M47_01225 [Hamadaea sp. NPDC051192]|uniref:hypothetical protein n=1 Tax=Hamadaea sp. NPDC051192 TaxID=3154940 RepID=UPI00342DCE74
MGGYDGDRGYAEERWPGEDRGYDGGGDWRERRGGYRDDDRGRGGYPIGDVNAGYGEPNRYGPPAPPQPQSFEPGYGPGPGSPVSGPGPAFGPRPPERAPMMDAPPTQIAPPTQLAPEVRPAPEQRSRSAERDADSGVYRSRKPMHAVLIGLSLGVFELIMFLVFVRGVFQFDVGRIVAGGLMMMALPLFGLGFYALITGAAHGGPKAFLKTPLAYLPIGLILMIAAGAAA